MKKHKSKRVFITTGVALLSVMLLGAFTLQPVMTTAMASSQNVEKSDMGTQTDDFAEELTTLKNVMKEMEEKLSKIEKELLETNELSEKQTDIHASLVKEKEELKENLAKLKKDAEGEIVNIADFKAEVYELKKKVDVFEEKTTEFLNSLKPEKTTPTTDAGTQTDPETSDASTQTDPETSDVGTQTDQEAVTEFDKQLKALEEKIKAMEKEIIEKTKLSDEQKKSIEELKAKEKELQAQLEKAKKNLNQNSPEVEKHKEDITGLQKKNEELNAKLDKLMEEMNKKETSSPMPTPVPTATPSSNSTTIPKPINQDSTGITQNNQGEANKENETIIRYPNKLTPKPIPSTGKNASTGSQTGDAYYNSTKVASDTSVPAVQSPPSKARGSVTENVNNAGKDYPIHHGDNKEDGKSNVLSADARQFITFQTKSGKVFHLIINHDEKSENIMLLTEVSENDLMNMVETKEKPKETVVKEEPVKEEPIKETKEPEKKEKYNGLATYLILFLVIAAALGAGYYFKVVKAKENKELLDLEEPEESFISEAEDDPVNESAEREEHLEDDEDNELL